MASCISDVEFERLQNQLLELRENNYTLDTRCHRYEHEFQILHDQKCGLEKELNKLQKTLARSKKAKDVEVLYQENESLQRKLESQEEEFRLQNSTLLQELSNLVMTNEELEKKLQSSSQVANLPTSSEIVGDLARLKAENAALLKSLTEIKELPNSTSEKSGASGIGELQTETSLSGTPNDLRLQLNIEIEEKNQWKDHATNVEKKLEEELSRLKSENSKISEKLKKKQESYQNLQEEKEILYTESKKTMDTLKQSSDLQLANATNEIQRLQFQLKTSFENIDKSNDTIEKLQGMVASLQSQVQNSPLLQEIKTEKASLEICLHEIRSNLDRSQKENHQLCAQLEESRNFAAQIQKDKSQLTKEIEDLKLAASDTIKVAEKRKQLVDDMAIKLQETVDQHQTIITTLSLQHRTQIEELHQHIGLIKTNLVELEGYKTQMETITVQLTEFKKKSEVLEEELAFQKQSLETRQQDWEEQMAQLQQSHTTILDKLRLDWANEKKDLEVQINVFESQKSEFEEQVVKLKQEIKDNLEERKIQDKKGVAMVKELKKQLQAERKRVEKLQEKMQELLSDPSRHQPEEILTGNSSYRAADTSSISSWSFMSGFNNNLDSTTDKDPNTSDNSSSAADHPQTPGQLEQETSSLLARLASVQQEKWILEEKLDHLETSNAAMAHDLMEKSDLIQYYCMDGKPMDPHHENKLSSVKRVVDFLKDDSMKDMNRRLQRMLEETLTKNMHLQKDLEILSNEMMKLKSQLCKA